MALQKVELTPKRKKPKVNLSSSQKKLLMQPLEYANKAIETIEDQLTRCRTENRRRKLQSKLKMWLEGRVAFLKAAEEAKLKEEAMAAAAEEDKKVLKEAEEEEKEVDKK